MDLDATNIHSARWGLWWVDYHELCRGLGTSRGL